MKTYWTHHIRTSRPHHNRSTSSPPCTKIVIKVYCKVDSTISSCTVLLEESCSIESSRRQLWENLITDACSNNNNQCDWHVHRKKYGPINRSSEIAAHIISWGKCCLVFVIKWDDTIFCTGSLWPLCNGISLGHRWQETFSNFYKF
jgi:hypothetical protein